MLLLPERSEISTLWRLPTSSGLMCSYVSGFFITALTWIPPLWANALSPTYGRCELWVRFAISLTNLDASDSLASCESGRHLESILSCRFGIMEQGFAFTDL